MSNNKLKTAQLDLSATNKLVGRTTAGAGAGEEVTLDTDGTLSANSDTVVATQKAVKSYSDSGASTMTNKIINDASNYIDADAIHIKTYLNLGGAATVGMPVYANTWNVGNSAVEVMKARANAVGTLANGLCEFAASDGTVSSMRTQGVLTNVNTNAWSEGTVLYVSDSAAGTLTATVPVAVGSYVQPVARVVRQHATLGQLLVMVDGATLNQAAATGGLTRDLWYEVPSGAYASTSTFTSTEASSGEATRLAELAERSLFTCTDSTGATRRIGYIKSASAASTAITYIVVTSSDLAAGDKNFRITPNRKVEDYKHAVSIPGEMIADASNPQGVWLLNLKVASYLLPVNSAVRTAAAGAGAACAWNVYAGASNLFSAAQDMTTSATFDEKRPTTNTTAVGDNISLRITSSAGATNKARDFQAELFVVPQSLYTSQA